MIYKRQREPGRLQASFHFLFSFSSFLLPFILTIRICYWVFIFSYQKYFRIQNVSVFFFHFFFCYINIDNNVNVIPFICNILCQYYIENMEKILCFLYCLSRRGGVLLCKYMSVQGRWKGKFVCPAEMWQCKIGQPGRKQKLINTFFAMSLN